MSDLLETVAMVYYMEKSRGPRVNVDCSEIITAFCLLPISCVVMLCCCYSSWQLEYVASLVRLQQVMWIWIQDTVPIV